MKGHKDTSGNFHPHGSKLHLTSGQILSNKAKNLGTKIRRKAGACKNCGRPVLFHGHEYCSNCWKEENEKKKSEGKWFKGNVFLGCFLFH